MRKYLYILIFLPLTVFAQEKKQKKEAEIKITLDEKNLVRDGNDLFRQNNFVDAEVKYKKALKNNPNYETANFNLGNAIYEQNRFKEAAPFYEMVTKTSKNKQSKAEAFHNSGNVSMKEKKYPQAVEAYKNSLRQNPNDEETRYNLALAKELLEQQKDQDKDDKNKDNKDQDKKDQQNKDNQNKDQDKEKEKEKNKDKKDQNKDNKNQDQQNDQKQEKQQPKPNQLSKQQMEQLLEAMNNEENKTQKKVNAKKAKGRKVKQEKDW